MRKDGPEKEVECEVLNWCLKEGWSIDVIDSTATYSVKAKSYKKSRSAKTGTPDLVGNTNEGRSAYIELKAPGINSLRSEQYNFLKRKIHTFAFACVARSAIELEDIYSNWILSGYSRAYLLSRLPTKIKVDGKIVNVSLSALNSEIESYQLMDISPSNT